MRIFNIVFGSLVIIWMSTGYAHPGAAARVDQLTHLIEAQPTQQAFYILRAAEFTREHEWQRAAEDFKIAQTLGEPAAASFELGKFHYLRAEYQAAYTQFSKYLQAYPTSYQANLYRARTSAKLGNLKAAALDYQFYFRVALDIHPGDFIAAAKLLAESGGRERALAVLDHGLERLGMNAQLQRYAVFLENGSGQTQRAIERWRQLEPMLGNSPAWRVTLAELYIAAAELDKAQHWLDRANTRLANLRVTTARQILHNKIATLHNTISTHSNTPRLPAQ